MYQALNLLKLHFNINLLNVDKHVPSSEFIKIMYSFSLYPLINKPRVTDKTTTLINNIFCNNMVDTSMFNGIFYTDITDHFPVFSISVKNNVVENQHYTIIRQYTEDNSSKFCSNIQTVRGILLQLALTVNRHIPNFIKHFLPCKINIFLL